MKLNHFLFILLLCLFGSCSKEGNEVTGDENDAQETLYLRLISPEKGTVIYKGEPTTIEFEVLGANFQVSNESYLKKGVTVHFSAEGELNPSSAISDANGKVSVQWTPTETGDEVALKAEIKNSQAISISFIAKVQDRPKPTLKKCVDLGLSVQWAGWNLGASAPEQYGDIYAWGETEKYDGDYEYLITYSEYIYIGNEISGTDYDTARAIWGKEWRLPTADEVRELFEKCEWRWCVYQETNGMLFTASNGNSIFLPAPGIQEISNPIWSTTWPEGTLGQYWTGTFRNYTDDDGRYAHTLDVREDRENCGLGSWNRLEGINIRAVSDY